MNMNVNQKSINRALLLSVVTLMLASAHVAATPVVVPNALAATPGNLNNCFPFGQCGAERYQQVFSSAEFSALGGPRLISQLALRRDEEASPNPFTITYSNVQIQLSTTSAAPDALSPVFTANQGADLTTVLSGALTVSSASSGSGGVQPFDVVISFATPFLYDPSAGNLLLDWTNLGSGTGNNVFFDAEFANGDGISRLFAFSNSSGTGIADSGGLIAEFDFGQVSVPEPNAVLLLGIGLTAFGLRRRGAIA